MLKNKKISLLFFIISLLVFVCAQEIPFVYENENTGAEFPKPILPGINDLPTVKPLPDPFEWSDGSGRDTTFASWSNRRAEIKTEIENYEIGTKPDRPDTIIADYSNGNLIVTIVKNGQTLILNSKVNLPEGEGPFPAIIGMTWFAGSGGTGSLPADIFTSRNIATIEFVHDQVTTYSNQQDSDPYYQLYPELNSTNTGQYSAWSWGISRLIDGLELVQDKLPIDTKHLAVTGCSYAGKMALFAGAFDERIALTIAQESGGGGAPAWRVSETIGSVERLSVTDHNWFRESIFTFGGNNVSKLPHDHHELMAMCIPRALLVTGNTDYEWLANPSCYVSARAVHKVYQTFGIGERFGFYIDGGHGHCNIPSSQKPAIEAFVDRFLLGDTTASTNIMQHPYEEMDYLRWFQWWGTGDPVLPDEPVIIDTTDNDIQVDFYEAECGEVGSNWQIIDDPDASNGKFVTSKNNLESISEAPTLDNDIITITFTNDTNMVYNIYGRVYCPSDNDDSFWVKLDRGTFQILNNLTTNGWAWVKLASSAFRPGEHKLTIGYRENGALLDKICISTNPTPPDGLGEEALNLNNTTGFEDNHKIPERFELGQNYPNPFNPTTMINYQLPMTSDIVLKVYDISGGEIVTLFEGNQIAGNYQVAFDSNGLSSGIYIYSLKSGQSVISKKMMLLK